MKSHGKATIAQPNERLAEHFESIFALSLAELRSGLSIHKSVSAPEEGSKESPSINSGLESIAIKIEDELGSRNSPDIEYIISALERESYYGSEAMWRELGILSAKDLKFNKFFYPESVGNGPLVFSAGRRAILSERNISEKQHESKAFLKYRVIWNWVGSVPWNRKKNAENLKIPKCLADFEQMESEAVYSQTHKTFLGESHYILDPKKLKKNWTDWSRSLQTCGHEVGDLPMPEIKLDSSVPQQYLVHFPKRNTLILQCVRDVMQKNQNIKLAAESKNFDINDKEPAKEYGDYEISLDHTTLGYFKETTCFDADKMSLHY